MDLSVLYNLTYGLYVVGSYCDGRPVGCVVNTCFQITSENPSVAISLNKNNFTLEALRRNPRFSLSIVAEDTDPAIIGKFGFVSSKDVDKYTGFGYHTLEGAPVVEGRFCGRLVLDAFNFVDCDTHVLVLARLVATEKGRGTPMTYSYYHNVVKGKAPKNAPTYRREEEEKPAEEAPAASVEANNRHRYRCDICGFEIECEGELPADYVCPLCGADRSHFVEF